MRALASIICIAMLVVSLPDTASAKPRKHKEQWYQERWCEEHGGETEVTLPNRKRIDCETETHVIEFDFADKWREGIGQSLDFALQSGKHAGIVLILESETDQQHLKALESLIEHFTLPIEVWTTSD